VLEIDDGRTQRKEIYTTALNVTIDKFSEKKVASAFSATADQPVQFAQADLR